LSAVIDRRYSGEPDIMQFLCKALRNLTLVIGLYELPSDSALYWLV